MFKNPFSFEGRIRRTEFGISIIIYFFAALILEVLATSSNTGGFIFFFYIPLIWFNVAQGAKRCHDRGNSGWYQLIPFYVFWMLFADGEPNSNEYGDDPKGREDLIDQLLSE